MTLLKTNMAASIDDGYGSRLLFISLRYFPHLNESLTVNKNLVILQGRGRYNMTSFCHRGATASGPREVQQHLS